MDTAGGRASDAMRVAAIDCGTNSIRLLVADVAREPDGRPRLTDVHREMRVVRLGQGVDATGRLSGHALDRTWRALADYAAIISASGAVRTRMVATSATRDAQNRADFVEMVRATIGQDPEVISGAEEAELTFAGAVGDLDPATGPFLVVDIGGGSTELVIGERDQAARAHPGRAPSASSVGAVNRLAGGISLDIGCVRITERILRSDPPTPAERDEARRWAHGVLLDGLNRLPVTTVRRLVPVSGTATTVAAAALKLTTYDPARIHLAQIPVDRLHAVGEMLLGATRAHRAALGYMHPGRVDVIGGGALILSTVVSLVAGRARIDSPIDTVTVSEHDILDGIALSLG